MKSLLIIIIAFFSTVVSYSQQDNLRQLTDSYMVIKYALIKSDSENASKKADIMNKIINNIVDESLDGTQINLFKNNRTALLKITEQIKNSNKIEIQRKSFAELSLIMWDIIKNSNEINQNIYYFYCPMKKTFWMSYENQVQNPYYGSKMLTCGSISDKRIKK